MWGSGCCPTQIYARWRSNKLDPLKPRSVFYLSRPWPKGNLVVLADSVRTEDGYFIFEADGKFFASLPLCEMRTGDVKRSECEERIKRKDYNDQYREKHPGVDETDFDKGFEFRQAMARDENLWCGGELFN